MNTECNTDYVSQQTEIDHLETLRFLKAKGYPMPRIRVALLKLLDVDQKWMARVLGQHPAAISQHINGYKGRRQEHIQQAIATAMGLPKEELFEE